MNGRRMAKGAAAAREVKADYNPGVQELPGSYRCNESRGLTLE
jgi:hypothetical protein